MKTHTHDTGRDKLRRRPGLLPSPADQATDTVADQVNQIA
jgi:hypothetical protein